MKPSPAVVSALAAALVCVIGGCGDDLASPLDSRAMHPGIKEDRSVALTELLFAREHIGRGVPAGEASRVVGALTSLLRALDQGDPIIFRQTMSVTQRKLEQFRHATSGPDEADNPDLEALAFTLERVSVAATEEHQP